MMKLRAGTTLLVLMILAMGAGAQDPRDEVFYLYQVSNGLSNALNSPFTYPSASRVLYDPDTLTLDAGEPAPTCLPAGATHAKSAWTLIAFQGGEMSIATGISNYDTIIQVYEYATVYANLRPLAGGCANQGDTGNHDAHLVANILPGFYLVQISEEIPSGGSPSVDELLHVFYTNGSYARRPRTDFQFEAQPLTQGVAFKQTNVEYATRENNDPAMSCDSGNLYRSSLWYRFDVPADGSYRFTLYKFTTGFIGAGGTPRVAVAAFANNAELQCTWQDTSLPITLGSLQLTKGMTVRFLVSPEMNYFPISKTSYKVKITTEAASFDFDPLGFEDGLLDGQPWTATGLTANDGIVCGAGAPTPCTFSFGGEPGTTTTLKGKYKLPTGFAPLRNDSVEFTASFSATEDVRTDQVKLKLKIIYSDGTPTTSVTFTPPHFNAFVFLPLNISATLASSKVSAIKVSIQNKNDAGFFYVDLPLLRYYGEVSRERDGVLPVPLPPQ